MLKVTANALRQQIMNREGIYMRFLYQQLTGFVTYPRHMVFVWY